ncbi:MAG: acetylserotonin O-methyltransferase [Acidobacteriota bacterium]|nr:acetylserotonin O-methyltransferase [Acidobacteriota bacterium]
MNNENGTAMSQLPPEAILSQMLWGGLIQQSIYAVTKLGVADLLAEKSQTAAELAANTETHAPSLYRVLRTLASVGIFAENADGKFELTPIAALLRKDAPNSMRDFALMLGGEWHWRIFSELMHSVKTGATAQEKACGAELFEYLANNPENAKVFNRAMTSHSQAAVPAIVEGYDFSGIDKLVDIGGGQGILLAGILKANPQTQGILFDMPSVIAGESELLEKEGVTARVEKVSGDFFQSVSAGADAYLMKHIIHDWDDEQSIKILQNIYSAMNGNGKVLIVEMVIPEGNEPSPSKILDLQMLIGTGGKERTEKEYRELLETAGFRLTRIIPTRSPLSIVEAVKN